MERMRTEEAGSAMRVYYLDFLLPRIPAYQLVNMVRSAQRMSKRGSSQPRTSQRDDAYTILEQCFIQSSDYPKTGISRSNIVIYSILMCFRRI